MLVSTIFTTALLGSLSSAFVLEPRAAGCVAPKKITPAGSNCRAKGTAKGNPLRSEQSCTNDYVGCYYTCYNTPACKSFAYNPINNLCRTFGKSTVNLGFKSSSFSDTRWWDFPSCFNAPPQGCTPRCPIDPNAFAIEAIGPAGVDGAVMFAKSGKSQIVFAQPGDNNTNIIGTEKTWLLDTFRNTITTTDGSQQLILSPQNQLLACPPFEIGPSDPQVLCLMDSSTKVLSCLSEASSATNKFAAVPNDFLRSGEFTGSMYASSPPSGSIPLNNIRAVRPSA